MSPPDPTGQRIRDHRRRLGLGQADLARRAGISGSYLNLIEHGRRRIGGRVLARLAEALGVGIATLTEGAEGEIRDALRAAAARDAGAVAETERIDEFVARFPGWAARLAAEQERGDRLERAVTVLSDRAANDPALSETLHDVLTAVTAISASAAILAEGDAVSAEWQARFHRNLHDDADRLAVQAQALAGQLGAEGAGIAGAAPQDERDAFLRARDWHVPELEGAAPPPVEAVVHADPAVTSRPGRALTEAYLAQYRADAEALPLASFAAAAEEAAFDPGRLAERFGCEPLTVFRRLAALPPETGRPPIGLAVCDGSGTLTVAKPLADFPIPRSDGACPLWPLYRALSRPGEPLRTMVEQPGPPPRQFLTFALCRPKAPTAFGKVPVLEAAMLFLPSELSTEAAGPIEKVGTRCRVCPRDACPARREPAPFGGSIGRYR